MKKCINCQQKFNIFPEDKDFYNRIDVPEPTHCSDCRAQRRLAWRSELCLYPDKCDHCKKSFISMYAPGHSFPVYCYDCWWGDSWDAKKYAKEIDWKSSIMEQVHQLIQKVPVCGIIASSDNINCEYNTNVYGCNNCYLCYVCGYSECCLYCYHDMKGKENVDCTRIYDCQLCYQSVQCRYCYNVRYSDHSKECTDSYFLSHCFNCQNCLGCVNLRNKQYHIFNKPYSKQEYYKKIKTYNINSRKSIEKIKQEFEEFNNKFPKPANHNEGSENVIGEYMRRSSNCYECYDLNNTENSRYCSHVYEMKDCLDNVCSYTELGYENISGIPKYMVIGTTLCNDSRYIFYSKDVMNSKNCFACVGLKKEQNCILNKQYSESEYKELELKLKNKMKRDCEWGEFFPIIMSPFAYNESVASMYHPLNKKEAIDKGYRWLEEDKKDFQIAEISIPDKSEEITQIMIGKTLSCECTGCLGCASNRKCLRNYKIIKQEFDYYKNQNIPIPNRCPRCRLFERFQKVNPRKLWSRKCMKAGCNKEFKTAYDPIKQDIIYCRECYNDAVM
jgi:hypothetical protein